MAERLAEIVETNVTACLRVIRNMFHADTNGWHIHSWREPSKTILRAALATAGKDNAEALDLINFLGRQGHTDFGDLL